MKNRKTPRVIIASLVAGGALVAAGSVMALNLSIGWQPDGRYWDGHSYYSQNDWMRHHPHDPGPRHHGPARHGHGPNHGPAGHGPDHR